MFSYKLLTLFLMALLCSCRSSRNLTIDEYVEYLNANVGSITTKESKYELRHFKINRSGDYIVGVEIIGDNEKRSMDDAAEVHIRYDHDIQVILDREKWPVTKMMDFEGPYQKRDGKTVDMLWAFRIQK